LAFEAWENSTVPNYKKAIRIGWLFSFENIIITMLFPQWETIEIAPGRAKRISGGAEL
jgi:hypothetical protein